MKSVIKTGNPTPEYPKLMQGTELGCVVLFTNHECGVVINGQTPGGIKVGYASENWNMDMFEPFTGTVELSNN